MRTWIEKLSKPNIYPDEYDFLYEVFSSVERKAEDDMINIFNSFK